MDHIQIGLRVRALRRRKGWRQQDLADAVGLSQSTISLIERGHLGTLAVRALARVCAALDASVVLELRWRGGALDRLTDEDHARLIASVVALLTGLGWEVRSEVTYAHYGERGSIDVLAFHPANGALLVIEVKTDVASAEATFRKLDEKVRLAPAIARERFGWDVSSVSRALVLDDTSTVRRRVARHRALFDAVVPVDGRTMRSWFAHPSGTVDGRLFLSANSGRGCIRPGGGRERVRRSRGAAGSTGAGIRSHRANGSDRSPR